MQSDVISKGTCRDLYHTIGQRLIKRAHCRSIIPHPPVLCIASLHKFAVQFLGYCITRHNHYAEAILVGICECYSKFAEFEPCPSHLQNWR